MNRAIRYICIHGHFYQPPRENPWRGGVERQPSASPYHDWNERVAAECYGPNAAARLLDGEGRIRRIVNNYASISFDIGPTLLRWMETTRPDVYAAILAADEESIERFDGHGSAIAQPYHHSILPLANDRDLRTEIRWGIRDFERRFRRSPEGMWLPETAVDGRTLEALAEAGIRFTILAPHQVRRVRPIDGGSWMERPTGRLDPTLPYLVRLRSGREIAVFLYHSGLSRAVAFDGLLESGDRLAEALLEAFPDSTARPRLVHIATDGETFGHHHRFGEMALAYALERTACDGRAAVTNYGAFLERVPPAHEVEIVSGTSWSCGHGVQRWRSDCGCDSGRHPSWHQRWRGPLRRAMEGLRDELAAGFDELGRSLFVDPWAARDAAVDLVAPGGDTEGFLDRHAARALDRCERRRALELLEMQRNALSMFTSCGWFFDDLAGIETVQILRYAARAAELADAIFADGAERRFIEGLARAEGNVPGRCNGRRVYELDVRPARCDAVDALRRAALESLYVGTPDPTGVPEFDVRLAPQVQVDRGAARLRIGRSTVRVRRTEEERAFLYAAFDLGDAAPTAAALDAGIERSSGCGVLRRAFEAGDSVRFVRAFARRWGAGRATLASLAAEDRDAVLSAILDRIDVPAFGGGAIVTAAESAGVDVAPSLRAARAAERLRAIEAGAPDAAGALATSIGGEHWAGDVDLRSAVARGLEQRLAAWISSPDSLPAIEGVAELIEAAARAGVEVSLWRAQNLVIAAIERERSRGTRTTAIDQALRRLADTLGIAPDAGSDEAV